MALLVALRRERRACDHAACTDRLCPPALCQAIEQPQKPPPPPPPQQPTQQQPPPPLPPLVAPQGTDDWMPSKPCPPGHVPPPLEPVAEPGPNVGIGQFDFTFESLQQQQANQAEPVSDC